MRATVSSMKRISRAVFAFSWRAARSAHARMRAVEAPNELNDTVRDFLHDSCN
jgi:hypothetical protein